MSIQTVNDIFYTVVERNAPQVMLYNQTIKWIPMSSKDIYRDAVGVSKALLEWGIRKGDRVAILSENRPEWAMADFGSALIGAVTVPIYPTLTAEQTAALLNDSGARVIFLSTADQLKKYLAIRSQVRIEKAVVMDYIGITEGIPMHRLMHMGPTQRDPEFDAQARTLAAHDLATIMYTSGTTGRQKGVMLTHGNLASNVLVSMQEFGLGSGDSAVSYLPLSHITARHVDYSLLYNGITIAYCPDMAKLPEVLLEIKPTFFVAVPRVYEKIRQRAIAGNSHGTRKAVFDWALNVGKRHVNAIMAGKRPASLNWKLADKLVYSKVRAGMGGRVRVYSSGGAPLSRELAEWFLWVGIRIGEGYGLTETSPVIARNTPLTYRLGTVGKIVSNLEVKIAEDGEILAKGPSIFTGYWNLPEETQNAFIDGFFKTGDIGSLDADGFLSVTDRKKELIKTSGGKFVAPQPIEGKLKSHNLVAEAVVVGDRHKFPAVLIVPDFARLEPWAGENDIPACAREVLIENPKVQAAFEKIVGDANQDLAQFEKIKRFLLLTEEFSIANGSLTPTMKLRRKVVEERYKDKIESLYSEEEAAAK